MHFALNVLTKCVRNNRHLFVSNNCLRFTCFSSHWFAVKDKHFINCHQNYIQNNQTVCGFRSNWPTSDRSLSTKSDNKTTNTKSDNEEEVSKQLKRSTETKFKKYSDEDSQVIYDITEELSSTATEPIPHEYDSEEIYLYQQKTKKSADKELKRGVTGVFDVQELVELLRSENIKDIAVIEVPKELNYCRYMVLGSAASKRHLNAFMEYFNKVYKAKKHVKDPFLDIGGKKAEDWKVVDMKSIVLHLFYGNIREHYDIETLWTVGHEFDEKIQRPEPDTVVDIMEKHMKYLEGLTPQN